MNAPRLPRLDRIPFTFDECRARFRRVAAERKLAVAAHRLAARGPDEQILTIDVTRLGAERPDRALLIMSGVHGVEGFIGSTLQSDLIARLDPSDVPPDMAVVVVHSVNPWGMAWWRRQNESNVDLNRNWRRTDQPPVHNDAYDEIHSIACPDTASVPSIESLVNDAARLVAERGLVWVRDAITTGQYRHPDGLHFGGDHTEESNATIERIVQHHLHGVDRLLIVDLHTGHGPRSEVTILSDAPPGSAQDQFFHDRFPDTRVEATAGNPDATTGLKSGQIGNGIGQLLPDATCFATSLEFGTASDEEQLVATYQEQWVHRHGDRAQPEHAAIVWAYRCCFTPDDPDWERAARTAGNARLDEAVAAVATWTT